jgi:ABC-type nitrate/sulfonate/bicarbonate transport system permease component
VAEQQPTPDASATRSRTRRRAVRWSRKRVLQVASVIVFLVIWQIIGSRSNPISFSTPLRVIDAFADLVATGKLQAVLPQALADLLVGYALAVVVGVGLGALIGWNATLEAVLNPYINFALATPLVAAIPIIVIFFGIGWESRILSVFVLAMWKILVNTATGMKSTPRVLREMGRVYHLSEFQQIREVMLLNAVPAIFAGLRIGLASAMIGMIIAESEVSVTGLGGLILFYGIQFKTAYLLAGIFTASIIGVLAIASLGLIQARAFPWVAATTGGRRTT